MHYCGKRGPEMVKMARLPSHYVKISSIAGGIAIVQSVLVSVVTVVLILQYSSCADVNASDAGSYFLRVLKQHYFQGSECALQLPLQNGVMVASQVYIWLNVLLAFSVIWLIASVGLIVASDESAESYFPVAAYTWVATTAVVFVVDVTLAIYFGLDFGHLSSVLEGYEVWNGIAYSVDLLRIGALLLMTLALKGLVLPLVNVSFAVTLLALANKASKTLQQAQHSMHSRGPLNAYTASNKRLSDPWQNPYLASFYRNAPSNRGLSDIENMSSPSWREPQNDLTNRSFDRSDSWHHSGMNPDIGGPRPFSYLEEPRSPITRGPQPPPAPIQSPIIVPPWRRDTWDQPPTLPAPDYSPIGGRRLKSALKPVM